MKKDYEKESTKEKQKICLFRHVKRIDTNISWNYVIAVNETFYYVLSRNKGYPCIGNDYFSPKNEERTLKFIEVQSKACRFL